MLTKNTPLLKRGLIQPIHIKNIETKIRGPKAKILTFENTLRNNNFCILKEKRIDFTEIYRTGWKTKIKNLFKYFIKIFGCHIATGNFEVS